ncbi:MAG: GDP-L-fucose synthase [Bacteroidaceae bacterium]|nr:GDP-L-fucose synthase [Bacteroidaceae bacterium]
MKKDAKIYVAGHRGLVGSAILANLRQKGYHNFLLRTHQELDLTDQLSVSRFFEKERPDYVFLAAAYVGGIMANNRYRADFIWRNLQIECNVIHQSYLSGVKKLCFLGSTCIYPREAPQPMTEDCLLTSPLEYTNEPYAISKIAGLKLCESYNLQYGTNFIAVMPTNLYGPNDNFNLETSHVLPALLRKAHLGKCLMMDDWDQLRRDLNRHPVEGINGNATETDILDILYNYGIRRGIDGEVSIEIWGTGKAMREFLWSEDMADACVFVMEKVDFRDTYESGTREVRNCHINIGTGKELSIRQLVDQVVKVVGYGGKIFWNADKPDGTARKLTDQSKLHRLGWHHQVDLDEGLRRLYRWYVEA